MFGGLRIWEDFWNPQSFQRFLREIYVTPLKIGGKLRWNEATWLIFRNGLVQPPTRYTLWSNQPPFLSERWWVFCRQRLLITYRLMGQVTLHCWMNFEDGSNESYHMSWKGFERSSQVVYAIQRLSLAGGWGSSHLGNDVEFDGKWSLTCWLRWHPNFVGQNFWVNERAPAISRFCKHFSSIRSLKPTAPTWIDAILKGKSSNPQFAGAMLVSGIVAIW